jgi:hypothetical protein
VVLQPVNSLSPGSLTLRGFDARMVQSSAANLGSDDLPNTVVSALAVLTIPPPYAVDQAATGIVQEVAWDLNASAYGAVTNFPGLCIPPANNNSYAIETLAYLELTAGPHRLQVDSDDAVGIFSGASLQDTSAMTILSYDGVFHGTVDFFAPAAGLYPFRIIYEEGGGAAYLVVKSVDLADNSQTLLNATDGVKAFYPLACKSSATVNGTFTVDPTAANAVGLVDIICDGMGSPLNSRVIGGTLTIPKSGDTRFYRLDGPRATTITGIHLSGSNVIITYQAQ